MTTHNDVTRNEEKLPPRAAARTVAPPVDIFENADEIVMYADFPGVTPDHVQLNYEKNQLTFSGLVQEEHEQLSSLYGGLSYRRTFLLPGGIDPEKISAELKNGVLKVRLPKQDRLKPRHIPVTAG
ncbi:MAG: Hsp20/alpha crystallin family protein [Myxococcota bacterium]